MINRAKIAWAYGRFVKHMIWFVKSSPTIETDNKDGMIKTIQGLYRQLEDAVVRERGKVPRLPSDMKKEKQERERTIRAVQSGF